MMSCQILLALCTVILVQQVSSQDSVEFEVLNHHMFVPFGESVWTNCSTPFPNATKYETRLEKNETKKGPNWVATNVIVDDWENSTAVCVLNIPGGPKTDVTIIMAYAVPSNVTIDLLPELEEGKENTINCTVYEVAPLQYLTINIFRERDIINSTSYEGPHVAGRRTVSHLYTFTASRSDNHMNFSCEAILKLGSETHEVKSPKIPVQTYTLPEDPVITVPRWIEDGTSFTVECLVANGFPPDSVNLKIFIDQTPLDFIPELTNEGTVKGTVQENATNSPLGLQTITCEADLFTLSKGSAVNVHIYKLPSVNFNLSTNVVDLGENVTATCLGTNEGPERFGLNISVDGRKEQSIENSTIIYTFTARRTPKLLLTCTAYFIENSDISQSSYQILEVHYPPEFTESLCPSSLLLEEGRKVSCQADGNPEPTVNCSADGQYINGAVTRNMSGIYTCQAENQKGGTRKIVNVTVQYKPTSLTLTFSPNATIRAGNPLNITCTSDGLPAPTYSWQIPGNAEVIYSSDESSIFIPEAAWGHKGTYTCVATNRLGNSEVKQEVTVVSDYNIIVLIIGLVAGTVGSIIAIITTIWLCKKGKKGYYDLIRHLNHQSHQNGDIPEPLMNSTTSV